MYGQAWPNNLVFTLKPVSGVAFKNNTLGIEIIKDNSTTFIGKFKNLLQAEVAQDRLINIGVNTELCAFFRAESITLEDAKILSSNMNLQEESTMLNKTSFQQIPDDRIILEPLPKVNEKDKTVMGENNLGIHTNSSSLAAKNDNNTYFTIQLGVFSKSAKHKFQIEVQERVINEKYYCFYGRYFSIDDAKKELMTIKNKGYSDAFITGFNRGNKVSPAVVKDLINSL